MEQTSSYFVELQNWAMEALNWARAGYAQVNAMQGIIIALVAAYRLSKFSRLLVVVAFATIVHAAADVFLPAIVNNTLPKLPPILQSSYWQYIAVLFAGYIVVIALFYGVKKTLLNR